MHVAFFDESGTHAGSAVVCVAGYLFDEPQVAHFEREWRDLLGRYGVPCFHMSDCAHGAGAFADIAKAERVELARTAIGIIRRRARMGLAAAVAEPEFRKVFPEPEYREWLSGYTLCAHVCLLGVAQWADRWEIHEPIRYSFEAGAAKQAEFQTYLQLLLSSERHRGWRERMRIQRYEFAAKSAETTLQAADLLAWQYYQDCQRRMDGRRTRLDFLALVESPHTLTHLDGDMLRALREKIPATA
jgi:hypothetical protein